MTIHVDAIPPCVACGGKRYPLVVCDTCGATSVLRDVQDVSDFAACPECGAPNTWQLICNTCEIRSAASDLPDPSLAPTTPNPMSTAAPRPPRRVKGDVDARSVIDLLHVLGLDSSRAQALIDRGYDALWKIARAKEQNLARIPEVGPVAARKMVASLHLLHYTPPRRTKESVAQDEYACSLCGCVTSAFALGCVECGAVFDEEEMEEEVRHSFQVEGASGVLAFYDERLAEKPDDWELHYARGLLLESLGRADEATASLDRAASLAPNAKKVRVAQLRVQAKGLQKPEVAAKLRSTAKDLLEDVAWEEEVAQLDRMISDAERECPSCGAVAPAEMALCPSCGLQLTGRAAAASTPRRPATVATPELDAVMDDLLVGELEEALSEEELELTKAAVLDWLIMELEESMAPETQVLRPPARRREAVEPAPPVLPASPLAESIGFVSRWMHGSRGIVSGLRPRPGPRGGGKVNGLVNGQGRVNGLVNGVGRTNGIVNGLGRVNGLATPVGRVNGLVTTRGRVNGLMGPQGRINGFVNGTQFVHGRGRGLGLPYPSRRIRFAATLAGVLVAVLIAGALFIPIPSPAGPITIDGSFQDWDSVPKFDAATVAWDDNVSIARYAKLLDRDSLYLFASTRGVMLGDAVDFDGLYFFIDGDGNPSSGFQFDGIGADAVVETFGGNHRVEGARLYTFPAGAEVNWSLRQPTRSVRAEASPGGMEAVVSTADIPNFEASRFQIAVYADDFRGASSRSQVSLSSEGAAILLEARPLTSAIGATPTALFEVRVRGLGLPSATTISRFTATPTPGVVVSFSPESTTLTQGQPNATVTASVSAPGFFPGDLVEVNLTGAIAPFPVVVRGGLVRAYMTSVPSTVQIDGLFTDWNGKDIRDSDSTRVNNSDVDITRYGAVVDATKAFFHVSVAGDLLGGRVPERFVRSPPGQGGNGTSRPIPLPRRTGEDLLRVYIDLNSTNAAGGPIAGIRADYLFEIRGDSGRIRNRSLYEWNASWIPVPLPASELAKNETDIEGSLALGPTTAFTRMVFATTDWSGIGDLTPPVNASVQGPLPAPERSGQTINAPEFQDLIVPMGVTLVVVLVAGRRRRRSP
jgi:tetratricopeptide (TPR) repeat protein